MCSRHSTLYLLFTTHLYKINKQDQYHNDNTRSSRAKQNTNNTQEGEMRPGVPEEW